MFETALSVITWKEVRVKADRLIRSEELGPGARGQRE